MEFDQPNLMVERLKNFEDGLVEHFKQTGLSVPLHLSGGNELPLIEIFRDIKEKDWVFTSHRSHYHALLKGMPEEELRKIILNGGGMTVMSREYRVYGSGIVGGHLPVALGVAEGIKIRRGTENVWAFCGDMAATTGVFDECRRYAEGHNLPIFFVIEDNGLSIKTPTSEVWGNHQKIGRVRRYEYVPLYPHHGFRKEGLF